MPEPRADEVRRFLNQLHRATLTRRNADSGEGRQITVVGARIGGKALEYESRIVHTALFPRIIRPVPMPRPIPRPPRPEPYPRRNRQEQDD